MFFFDFWRRDIRHPIAGTYTTRTRLAAGGFPPGRLGSIQADGRRAVEAFGEINWITHRNLLRVHLVGPDFEVYQLSFAVNGCEGSIHRIRAVSDFYPAGAGDIKT